MNCLAPCPGCQRHVSTHETACPFCAAALPASFRCQRARVAPAGRLSRAARAAVGAALMNVSCGAGVAIYGVAIPPDDAGADTSTSDGSQDGAAQAQLEQTPARDRHRH